MLSFHSVIKKERKKKRWREEGGGGGIKKQEGKENDTSNCKNYDLKAEWL